MAKQQYVRVQERGQVTLPAASRRRLGIKHGDLVAVVDEPGGIMIKPQAAVALEMLEKIGDELRAQGVTLEELTEDGRNLRPAIMKELYGIDLGE